MRQCRIDPAVRHLLDCVHILILKLADFADLSEDFTVRSSHERGEHEGQGLDDWIPQWRNCRVWQDRSFRLVRRLKSSGPGHVLDGGAQSVPLQLCDVPNCQQESNRQPRRC